MTSVSITIDSDILGETTIRVPFRESHDDNFTLAQIDRALRDAATRIRRSYFIDTDSVDTVTKDRP